jgi:TRAP-type uncharacterized transport system substrate-binding protein
MLKQALRGAAALAFAVVLAGGGAQAQQKTISIGTGGTGGVYYPLGGGMANILTQTLPGFAVTAEVTGGSVDNLKLVGQGKPYLGMTMADAALDAREGQDKFKGNKVPVTTIAVMYPNIMHVATVEGTGIEKMADLKGRRVSTGSPGSATEVMAFRVIKGGSYPGIERETKVVAVWNLLVTNEKMEEKVVYDIVKTIFEKKPQLVAVHKEAENITLENQTKENSPLPWHPGAVKYFAEKGVKLN